MGDRVAYTLPLGAYRTLRVVAAERLVKLPRRHRLRRGRVGHAQGIDGAISAHLVLIRSRRGDTVLVHAAAGGVGLLLGQWLKVLGADIDRHGGLAGKSRPRQGQRLYPRHRLSRRGFRRRGSRRSPDSKGCDVVYDSVGKDTWRGSLKSLTTARHVRPLRPVLGNDRGFQVLRSRLRRLAVSRRGPCCSTTSRAARSWPRAPRICSPGSASGQIKAHIGQRVALAAMRPPRTATWRRRRTMARRWLHSAAAYKLASMNADSCDLDTAPTLVATTSPFLKSISVGMPRT